MYRYLIATVKVTVNKKCVGAFANSARLIIPFLSYKYYGVLLGAQVYQLKENPNVFVIYMIYRNNRFINRCVNAVSSELACLINKCLKGNAVCESLFNVFNTRRIL